MIRPDELKAMDREKLLEYARVSGVKVHPRSKDDTLRRVITEQLSARQMKTQTVEEAPKPKPEYKNTPEDVLEAVGSLKDKEGYEIKFPGDNTVIFTYRGISESCNLSIPLEIIKRQAQMAARTKYAPKMVRDDEYQGRVGVMMFG